MFLARMDILLLAGSSFFCPVWDGPMDPHRCSVLSRELPKPTASGLRLGLASSYSLQTHLSIRSKIVCVCTCTRVSAR